MVQTQVPSPRKNGFSGKQVVGIIFGVLILLAIGLAIGGAIGYRLGTAEGAQLALANRRTAQLPSLNQRTPNQQAPNQQAPQNQQTPRGFNLPFDQQLPAINPGGPYLGVTFEMITPEIAAQEGITGTTGALVREVVADGPAAKAGLKAGDVVTAVNGQPVNDQNDLRTRVATFKPNDEITLTVVKGTANGPTDQHDVKVTLGERPAEQSFNFGIPFGENGLPQLPFGNNGLPIQPNASPSTDGAYLGVEFELLTPDVAAQENMTGTTGALIKTVVADSPAAKAGLKAGDVISAVDGKAINETNNLSTVVLGHKSGDEITLTIVKGTANGPTDQHDVKITLATRPAQPQFQMPQPGVPSPDSREG
ncbi:MAG TPA: PDZ domain-containing protein [Anaerolineae bacterium]|nr:PDZ domain-containing protein [Anaerolineae bacterium]